ncbi:MAG: C13 family peptidase [Actinomycetota bacterium]
MNPVTKPVGSALAFVVCLAFAAACGFGGGEPNDVLAGGDETDGRTAADSATTTLPITAVEATTADTAAMAALPTLGEAVSGTLPVAAAPDGTDPAAPTTATAPAPAETTTTVAPPPSSTSTAAPTTAPPTSASTTAPPSPPADGLVYKGVLIAGDDEITAFDNARKTIRDLFIADGVQPGNLIGLSREAREQTGGVRATSVGAIEQAMLELNVGDGDACIVFMTSHGNQRVFAISGSNGLTPDRLDQILTAACGTRPTVALVSACYSGIFISPLARPHRVVLTAASPVNTSFGCSPEATYTYWDGCLITHFAQASTWEDLYGRVTGCIESKEAAAGVTPSRPQAHFGAEVSNLRILNR